METTYKNCQSCGMPMSRDPKGGGTNADGSRSATYCSHCYAEGKFTLPDITVEQMQGIVKEKLREFGFPSPLGWFFARKVPRLARWNDAGTAVKR
jgi:hypothetical protein